MGRARTWTPDSIKSLALLIALVTALALVAPAAAHAWTQNQADGQNTAQSSTDGPDDPGLAWFTELADLTSDAAPDGYRARATMTRFDDLNEPVLSPDGSLIQRAQAQGGDDEPNSLIALDPDDGSLAWEEPDVAPGCGQALDGQDRLWFVRDGEDVLEALDPETGEPIDDTRVELDMSCQRTTLVIGGDPETIVIPDGIGDEMQAVDVSGDEPAGAWTLDLSAGDAPFDEILGATEQGRLAAVTDDSVIVGGLTGEDEDAEAELVRLSLDDGSVLERTDLPDPVDGDVTDVDYATYLVDDETLVVGLRRAATGDGDGYVAGYDLDTLERQWFEATEDARGPNRMNLGADDTFHHNAHDEVLRTRSVATGELQWDTEISELAGVQHSAVTDASGTVYAKGPTTDDTPTGNIGRTLTQLSQDGSVGWRATYAAIADAADIDPDDIRTDWMLGPIDDGTLYAVSSSSPTQIVAIDDSGGLALEDACVPPFDDVSETNVHAENICRLVEREITTGVTEDRFDPRGAVTRAQMASFLARALDLDPSDEDRFPDVNPDSVHAPNINAIAEAEITLGRDDGTYDPDGSVTRAEMASFLARSAELEGVAGTGFDDVDADSVHAPNIYAIRDAGITEGVAEGRYDPDGDVRREQMASFLIRMVDFLE